MPRPLFVLAAVLVLPALAAADDPLPGPPITLPQVDGFTRGQPIVYKDRSLGYSVGYSHEEISATVYVYNQNRAKIPAGPDSDTVKAEMLDAISAVEANKGNGAYRSINPIAEKIVPLGTGVLTPQFRWKQYHVELKSGPAVTELFLTGYKDHFVKLRVTYLSAKAAANRKALKPLLDALGKALE
jgi:hypothetical protein